MKIQKFSFIILKMCFFAVSGYAQNPFDQNYDGDIVSLPVPSNFANSCLCDNILNQRYWPSFSIPSPTSVVKTIKIDFNVLQNGLGGGNFTNDPIDPFIGKTRLVNIIAWINGYYNSNATNNMPPQAVIVNELTKPFVQFELGDIYFYNDPIYWKSSDVNSLLTMVQNDQSRPNAVSERLQIFFSEGFYNAKVSHIKILNGGSGYTQGQVNVNISLGCNAQVSSTITSGTITEINVTYPPFPFVPSTYTSNNNPAANYGQPIVTITGNGGSGASAVIDKMDGVAAYAPLPSACNLYSLGYVLAFGAFHSEFVVQNQGDYASSTTLAHELGHNLDLIHTYTGGGTIANCTSNSLDPTYLEDIYGLNAPGNCPHNVSWSCANLSILNKIDNNMMGGNQCAGYFSPKQIGYIQRALKFKSVRKYLKECYYDNLTPTEILNSEIWDFDIVQDADIHLNPLSSLDLDCKLSMPQTSKIIIEGGAIANIDGIITNNCFGGWDGIIEVKAGAILHLKASTDITFIGNGKIVVDDDPSNPGKLIFDQGAKVYLDGLHTKIEINGDLELGSDALFSFLYHTPTHGYISFGKNSQSPSRNIIAGSNASINLTGASSNSKILEITQETFYAPANLVSFNISHGKVEFGSNSRMQADGLNTLINFNAVRFTSNTPGLNNGHRGVHLYGQPNISIINCIFEYGHYGIFSYMSYGGAPLSIYSSTFRQNDYGIKAHDKGINLFQCNFFNNVYGLLAQQMSFPSTVVDGLVGGGVASANINGFQFQGHSTPSFTLDDPLINTNNIGVRVDNCALNIKCGSISYNQTGISFNYGANLFMNDQIANPLAATVSVFNNINSIQCTRGWYLWLNKGYNNLAPSTSSNLKTVNGTLMGLPYSIIANINKWNGLGTLNSLDYRLTDIFGNPYTLNDIQPQSSTLACGQAVPSCPNPPCPNQSPIEGCPSCDEINTDDFQGVRLDVATNRAIDTSKSSVSNKYKKAVELFCQILSTQYSNPNDDEKYLLSLNYAKMMESLGNAFRYGELSCMEENISDIVLQVLAIQDVFIDNASTTNNYDQHLKYSLDKAQTLRLACRRKACLELLGIIEQWAVGEDDMSAVQQFICTVNTEIGVLDGTIPLEEIDEHLTSCGVASSARTRNANSNLEVSKNLPFETNIIVNILNNRPSNLIEVKSNIEQGVVTLADAVGKIFNTSSINYECTIDVTNLKSGVYFVKTLNTSNQNFVTNKIILE